MGEIAQKKAVRVLELLVTIAGQNLIKDMH
jgi:hypothetical protein